MKINTPFSGHHYQRGALLNVDKMKPTHNTKVKISILRTLTRLKKEIIGLDIKLVVAFLIT